VKKSVFIFCFTFIISISCLFAMGEVPSKTTTTVRHFSKNVEVPIFNPTYNFEVSNVKIEQIINNGKRNKLSWKNPEDNDFVGVLIVVRTDRYPENVKDHEGDGKVLIDLMGNPSEIQNYAHSLFYPKWMKVTYKNPNQYYLVVAYDRNGNYSKGVKGWLVGKIM
jgi:hypothetical protein